jgi:hypothetical protein
MQRVTQGKSASLSPVTDWSGAWIKLGGVLVRLVANYPSVIVGNSKGVIPHCFVKCL